MSSILAQLLTLMEEGDENARADIMREFPGFFKSRKMIEDFNKKKATKRKVKKAMGGIVNKRGVGKAIKGFGRA